MRHQSRESAFKVIYQMDMGDTDVESALEHIAEEDNLTSTEAAFCKDVVEEDNLSETEAAFCTELVTAVIYRLEQIDIIIQRNMTGWRVNRLMSVDRNLLRLATYEIVFSGHISPEGAINEAVEMAKIYGQEQSSRFINSVLDKIRKNEPKQDNVVSEAAKKAAEEEKPIELITETIERVLTEEEAEAFLKEHQ